MRIIEHEAREIEDWRPGVRTRMLISAVTGATRLCLFEQWVGPGLGAPTHLHPVEEIVTVIDGQAQLRLEDQTATAEAGASIVVPAGARHSFTNSGQGTLHIQFVLAAPYFEAIYGDGVEATRRWVA